MAFVLDRDNFTLVPDLAALEQVNELQERLNYQADKFNLGRAYVERRLAVLRRDYDFYLARLHTVLIEPLLAHLNGSSLVIVPHGNLHTLPFHALFDGQTYLAEKFEISYAPSARVLLHCLTQPDRPHRKLLGLAVPDELLTGVEKEVRLLGDLFAETRLLVGLDATLPALQQNLAWCDVLHLASHGVFREDNPLFSLLKLADGWLSVQDVMDWRFQPSLVTLSACQTGLSRPLFGDELLGLARGFLSAGASSLVVSLWSVNDEVTTQLMQYFYEALLAGQNRAAALQTAMRKLRSESPYTHPHYWAPFVLVGRP
jgi:CHAT domain-containing protein